MKHERTLKASFARSPRELRQAYEDMGRIADIERQARRNCQAKAIPSTPDACLWFVPREAWRDVYRYAQQIVQVFES